MIFFICCFACITWSSPNEWGKQRANKQFNQFSSYILLVLLFSFVFVFLTTSWSSFIIIVTKVCRHQDIPRLGQCKLKPNASARRPAIRRLMKGRKDSVTRQQSTCFNFLMPSLSSLSTAIKRFVHSLGHGGEWIWSTLTWLSSNYLWRSIWPENFFSPLQILMFWALLPWHTRWIHQVWWSRIWPPKKSWCLSWRKTRA